MHCAIISQIGALAVDRLLQIAHHAEVAGARRFGARLKPAAVGFGWPRQFEQNGELRWVGILRFVENDAEVLLAHAARGGRMLQQFICERDLIRVSDDAALQAEIAVIALHFRGHAECGLVHPFAERAESFAPAPGEFLCTR